MVKSRKLYGVVVGAVLLASCQPMSNEERHAYDKRPAVEEKVMYGAVKRITLKTRPNVILSYTQEIRDDAEAIVIYFPGGNGKVGGIGFRNILPSKGIGYIRFNPPSDKPNGYNGHSARLSSDHEIDIKAVVRQIRKNSSLPIWLVGHSSGSLSVAYFATRHSNLIDGAVLLASVTENRPGRSRGTLVSDMKLRNIKIPLLVAAHKLDACLLTPPSGAQDIINKSKNAPVKQAKLFEGGYGGSKSCSGPSYHTFNGVRPDVADFTSKFILKNSKPQPAS